MKIYESEPHYKKKSHITLHVGWKEKMMLAVARQTTKATSNMKASISTLPLPTRIVFDRGKHVEAKDCITCGRVITWRKKWERCWDEVTTCSKRCKTTRRRELRRAKRNITTSITSPLETAALDEIITRSATMPPLAIKSIAATTTATSPTIPSLTLTSTTTAPPRSVSQPLELINPTDDAIITTNQTVQQLRKERKKRKKLLQKNKRAKREGRQDPSIGRKDCQTCAKASDVLVRCRIDATKNWFLICGKCWNKYSGGVPDGDLKHPHYCYGGVWKNLHKV